jgi:hypothetical protein
VISKNILILPKITFHTLLQAHFVAFFISFQESIPMAMGEQGLQGL